MSYIDTVNTQINAKLGTAYEIGLVPVDVKPANKTTDEHEWEIWGRKGEQIAIKRPSGIDVNFHAHWDGKKYSCWLMSIDDEWLLAGRQGRRLVSNCFTMFSERCRVMDEYFDKLIPMLDLHKYVGFVNLCVSFEKSEPKFRDLYFGITDLIATCVSRLYSAPLATLFVENEGKRPVESLVRGFAGFMRVFAYPYQLKRNRELLDSIEERPELFWDYETPASGSYVVIGRGDNIAKLWNGLYAQVEGLPKHGVCFRPDGSDKARQTFYSLKQKHII